MGINRLNPGEPIDLPALNKIIDELKRLENANRLTAKTSRVQNYTSSGPGGSNIHTTAFRRTRKLTRVTGVEDQYYGDIGRVDFPTPLFIDPPIISVTFEGSTYLVPHINSLSTSGFNLAALRVSKSWADVPTSVTFHVIAVGPVKG
jgi:hypothetical protein